MSSLKNVVLLTRPERDKITVAATQLALALQRAADATDRLFR